MSSQEPTPASPPPQQQQQRESGTLWASVESFGDRHPILYDVLVIVLAKLRNGMSEIYADCDVNSDHYGDMMNLGGTFGLMGKVTNVEEELEKQSSLQHEWMAFAISDENGIRFNYDLVTASTAYAEKLKREGRWEERNDDKNYWAYRVFLEVLCEHELAHAKNHMYKRNNRFTLADTTPGGAPLYGESGYTIERLLQAHRKGEKTKPRTLAKYNILTVKDEFRKNRYNDLEVHYGLLTSSNELFLNSRHQNRSLGMHQMYKHVEYFSKQETLSWMAKKKSSKRRRRDKRGEGGGSRGDRGHSGKDGGDGGGNDGADDGESESSASKKPRAVDVPGGVTNLTLDDSHVGGGDPFGGKPSTPSSDESSSSSDEDSSDEEDDDDEEEEKKQEAKYKLQQETVVVDSKKFTKYTVDCSGLQFVSEDGKPLEVAQLHDGSKGAADRKALLVDQDVLSDKVLDGIHASVEKCSAKVSFCDENWNDRDPAIFNKNEAVCLKLKLTNLDHENTGTVAAVSVGLYSLGRSSLNIEIKDSDGKRYENGPGHHFGLGTWVPIAPGKSYTIHRGLTRKTYEQCKERMINFVTPPPGVYSVAVIHKSNLTGRKFTFPDESKLQIVEGEAEA